MIWYWYQKKGSIIDIENRDLTSLVQFNDQNSMRFLKYFNSFWSKKSWRINYILEKIKCLLFIDWWYIKEKYFYALFLYFNSKLFFVKFYRSKKIIVFWSFRTNIIIFDLNFFIIWKYWKMYSMSLFNINKFTTFLGRTPLKKFNFKFSIYFFV